MLEGYVKDNYYAAILDYEKTNFDVNVDGRTDGRTDGQKFGLLYKYISHPAISRCDNNK